MAEVTRQMGPVQDVLQKLHEWQLAFWSNGSGRPPGQFQTRVEQDDKRYQRLEDETKEQSVVLAEVRDFMVGQVAAREAREKAEKEHAKKVRDVVLIAKWAAGVLFVLLSWAATKAIPVAKILIDDYLRAHPQVTERLKNKSSGAIDPALSYWQKSKQVATE